MRLNLLIVTALSLLCSFSSYSQHNAKIKYRSTKVKMQYPALIRHLTKENTYLPVWPETLTYYKSKQQMQMENLTFPYSDMYYYFKARLKKAEPSFYLIVEANGVTNLQTSGVNPTRRGYVIDYTYNFPCKLIIQDSTKRVVFSRELIREGEAMSVSYNKALPTFGNLDYNPVYFSTAKEAADFMALDKDIPKNIEKYAMLSAYQQIVKIVPALYASYSEKQNLGWAIIEDDNGIIEYMELNKAVEQVKQAYDSLSEGKIMEASPLLESAKQVFEKYSNSTNTVISQSVKKMIYFNLGWVSLVTGDVKTATENYAKSKPLEDIMNMGGLSDLESGITTYKFRSAIKQELAQ